MTRRAASSAVALFAAGLASACARTAAVPPPVDLSWTLNPSAPIAGPAVLTITLRRPDGGPIAGATVHLEAHMSHPGMAPVVADARERTSGVYEVPFAFTMPGDWILLVTVAPPGEGRVERRIEAKVKTVQGASPLGLPYTLSRAPLRRRAPFAWLARGARSRPASRLMG